MKLHHYLPAVFCLALIVGEAGCRDSKAKPAIDSTAAQDTMLLRDLAEANRNTAAAAAVDNSLNTVRTSADGSLPDLNAASQARPSDTRVVPRTAPPGSDLLTSGRRVPQPKTGDSSSSRSPSSSGNPCDSPAPVDQRSCLNRSIVLNDAELNRTYQDLIAQSKKSGGPELEQRFRDAQRDWVNQRDVDCRGVGEGALWARARARCLADHSEKRTAELRRNLNSLRGQGQ